MTTTTYFAAIGDTAGERGYIRMKKFPDGGERIVHCKYMIEAAVVETEGGLVFKTVGAFNNWEGLLNQLGSLPWDYGYLGAADLKKIPSAKSKLVTGSSLYGLETMCADDGFIFRIHGPSPHAEKDLTIGAVIALVLRRTPNYEELEGLLDRYVPDFHSYGWAEESDEPEVKRAHRKAMKLAEANRLQREVDRLRSEAEEGEESEED